MTFRWEEYLTLAEELGGPPPVLRAGVEARLRAAVSRAYYAGFILARNRLRDVDGVRVPANSNPHRFVAQHYRLAADLTRAEIGTSLGRLRVIRTQCDYDDVVPRLPALVRQSLTSAARVVANLRRL
jgi:hypothetical protein